MEATQCRLRSERAGASVRVRTDKWPNLLKITIDVISVLVLCFMLVRVSMLCSLAHRTSLKTLLGFE